MWYILIYKNNTFDSHLPSNSGDKTFQKFTDGDGGDQDNRKNSICPEGQAHKQKFIKIFFRVNITIIVVIFLQKKLSSK